MPSHLKLHPVFHVEKLSKATELELYSSHEQPGPLDIKGKPEYEVDCIIDSKVDRHVKHGLCYLV